MSRKTKIYLLSFILLLLIDAEGLHAQKKVKKRYYPGAELRGGGQKSSSFLSQQWYLGLIVGVNLTDPIPDTRYSTFSPIDKTDDALYKQYESYNKPGIQAGLDITYSYRFLSVSLQPNFRRQSFSYSNRYEWVDDTDSNNTLELNYNQDHNLDYLEIPLILKISFLQGNIKPYVGLGGYYGWLVNANKSITVDGVDKASGSSNPFNRESLSVGATSLFVDNNAGVLGAIGVSYDPGNIRLTLDIQYRYGLSNIANTSNRFTDNRLAGIGDALDDLTLNNIAVNIGILFPLRFLSNEFSSTE
jgi:hypothetical protein